MFYTDTEGGLVSRVSPLCNSMHYMLSLPSVSVQHLKRRFLFPSLLLCSVAPRLVTTQAETDQVQPQTRLCVCLCVRVLKLSISISPAKHPFLKKGTFHMGVSLHIGRRGVSVAQTGILHELYTLYNTVCVTKMFLSCVKKAYIWKIYSDKAHILRHMRKKKCSHRTYSVSLVMSPLQDQPE